LTQNSLEEQYFVILRDNIISILADYAENGFDGARLNLYGFEAVRGRVALAATDRLLAPGAPTPIVTPVS
jgi:hypothetical protein